MTIRTKPLTAEDFKTWTDALRSGKYVQGQGRLKNIHWNAQGYQDGYEYCCLGVLNEVCELGVPAAKGYLVDTINTINGQYSYLDATTYVLLKPEFQRALAHANDHGAKFDVIADMIEKDIAPLYLKETNQ